MAEIVMFHLRGLTRFSGRETRRQFWLWFAIVVVVMQLASLIAAAPLLLASLSSIRQFAAEHPEAVTVTSGPGSYVVSVDGYRPEFLPDLGGLAAIAFVLTAIMLVLLAAAVARRLQDAGRAPVLGLLPLPFLAIAMVIMPGLFESVTHAGRPDVAPFLLLFINNLMYVVSLTVLIVLLVMPTREEAGSA